MYNLILDCSTEKGLVAIAKRDSVVFEKKVEMRSGEEKALEDLLTEGLESLSATLDQIKAVAVSSGPGFFTSIRRACAFAKGLSFGKSIPLVGFCSLSGFTMEEEGRFASLIDARVRGAFFLIQEQRGKECIELTPPEFCPIEKLPALLQGCKKILGPSLGRLSSLGQELHEMYPNSAHLARVVENKLVKGDYSINGNLDLIYLRPSH